MRKTLLYLVPVLALALLVAGCAGPEKKAGRGVANTMEIIRLSELQRQIEQHGLFDNRDGMDDGIWAGALAGMDRSITRTGLGLYEIVTFPIPPYHPVLTNYLTPSPAYPDAYQPRKWDIGIFDTDHSLGFSGGDIAPWSPGSRFRVFDN